MTKRLLMVAMLIVASLSLWAQLDSLHIVKLGHKDYQWNLNDIWGYADTVGNEYALIGAVDGFRVVDVTTPSNLQDKIFVPGAYSLWRDVKSWSHYAYVSHDFQFSWSTSPNDGILIVDLDSLQSPRSKRFKPAFQLLDGSFDTLETAHNVFVDENGILYVFGASGVGGQLLFKGGALMFDLATDPWNPIYVGRFEDYYFHDGYARNDTLWAGAINLGFLSVINVSQKSNPVVLATKVTPNQFTHNCWLSDDGKTIFTTDEKPSAFIAAYDVSNLSNITEVDKIRTLPGTMVIPHNVHVYGDFVVTSYYTRGAHIVDAKYPDLLVEVGFYDTSPNYSGNGYNGAWGAYPFLPSGNLIISDMEEGLYVLAPEYKNASRVYGVVKDSLSGNTILNADVQLKVRNETYQSGLNGSFKAGFANDGWDTIVVTKFGYKPLTVPFQFVHGNYDTIDLAMLPITFSIEEAAETQFELYPNPSKDQFSMRFDSDMIREHINWRIYTLEGKMVRQQSSIIESDELMIVHNLPSGVYIVNTNINGEASYTKLVVE